jgi:hypothetical protein
MEETSLDDFLDHGSPDATEAAGEAEGSGTTRGTERRVENVPETTGEPDTGQRPDGTGSATPAVTAAWSNEPAGCPECGEPTAWRWAQDDEMVCAECKVW